MTDIFGRDRAVVARRLLGILLALVLQTGCARAAGAFELTSDTAPIALRGDVRVIFETGKALDPEAIARLSDTGKPHPLSPPNYGRYSQPVWGYVAVNNRLERREWFLLYSLSTVEDLRIFIRRQGETSFHQLPELGQHARFPFTGYRSATYSLVLDRDSPVEIVARLATRAPIGFHLQLWTPEAFIAEDRQLVGLAGAAGIVPLVVLVYLLILSTVLRQRGLVNLMIMLVFKLVLDAWISGLSWLVLPNVPRDLWPTLGFAAHGIFSVAAALHFRRFLELPKTAPWTDRLVLLLGATGAGLALIELSGLTNVRYLIQLHAPLNFSCLFALRRCGFGALRPAETLPTHWHG